MLSPAMYFREWNLFLIELMFKCPITILLGSLEFDLFNMTSRDLIIKAVRIRPILNTFS